MSMTLNAAVCLRKQKTKCSFRNSLARNWKAAQKPSVRTTHCHGKWVALTPPEQILWAIGKEALRAKEWIQTQHETQNLCTVLTEQLTKKCLYTPCRENAGTNMRAGTGSQSVTGVVWMQLPRYGGRYLLSSLYSSRTTEAKAPLWLRSSGRRVLAQKLAGPMAAVVKNTFPEEGGELADGVFRQSEPHFVNVQRRRWRLQHCRKKAPEVFLWNETQNVIRFTWSNWLRPLWRIKWTVE